MEYGGIDDFLWMKKFFKKDLIEFTISKSRNLSRKTRSCAMLMDMNPDVLDQNMALLCNKIGSLKDFSFYLSGGTGIALQLGQRKSFDFDFFTNIEFLPEEIEFQIKKHKLSVEGEIGIPNPCY